MTRIAVIGAGSYGTCLAILLGGKGHQVSFWCRSADLATRMSETRVNDVYLPDYRLPESVRVTTDLADAVRGAHIVVGVTPSHAIRDVFGAIAEHLGPDAICVNASKGIEEGSHARIDEIYREVLPPAIAARACYLSGPTFAIEVAAGKPSAIVIAGRDADATREAQEVFSTDRFRVYSSDDVVGVQIGGALKNVIAICAGMSDGLELGNNARAALITRGLAEIARIGTAQNADPMTFAGLSGLGDLVLTCTGALSRNRRVGLALAEGKTLEQITGEMRMVAEGVKTTRAAHQMAAALDVRAPLSDMVYRILYEGQPVRHAVTELMTRSLRDERD